MIPKIVNQTFTGIREVKLLEREGQFLNNFARATADNASARKKMNFMATLPRMVLENAAQFVILAVLGLGVLQGRPLSEFLPMLGVFGIAAFRLMPSFNRISVFAQSLHFSQAVTNVLAEDLAEFHSRQVNARKEGPARPFPFTKEIRFDALSFRYDGVARLALDNIALTIKRGQSVAFVGASGSGKSTLINLLLGLHSIQMGSVTVDGCNISENLRGWRANIGLIPQDVFLLDDSLKRNITFGLPSRPEDEDRIRHAVALAQLNGLVERLPDGLDTGVGERGLQLSGGERQRVGIARALFRDAQLLIMDEATSALDANTEFAVAKAINRLKGERTLVIVAHRLSTVQHCDQIFFLDGGKIVARGSFDELVANSPAFASMVSKMQLGAADLDGCAPGP